MSINEKTLAAPALVWEGPQRNLFQKYPELRKPTMKSIAKNVKVVAEKELAKM